MTTENWIEIFRISADFLKALAPYFFLGYVLFLFKSEIKNALKRGGIKLSTPWLNAETVQHQQRKVGTKEKREIEELNSELSSAKEIGQKLRELQEYTARDKDTFFLGYHFEKTYRLIFPSQMAILNCINNNNGVIGVELMSAFYSRTVWAQKFNVTYDQYVGFMHQSGLIMFDDTNKVYSFAPLGTAFWEYIRNMNMSLKLPANDFVETA